MPRIVQYEAPENLGLRPTEVGITATAAAARRVGAEYSEAAAAKSDTGRRFGSAISEAGAVAVNHLAHEDISQGAPAFAGLMAGKIKLWDDTLKANTSPDGTVDPTTGKQFLEKLEPDLEKFKSGFLTEKGQQWAEARVDQFRNHMFEKTTADMTLAAGENVKIQTKQTLNNLSVAARLDSHSLDESMSTWESSVKATIGTSGLTGISAVKASAELLQTGNETIVKATALGEIERTGKVPDWIKDPKYSKYINIAEVKDFDRQSKYYNSFNRAEANAQRTTQEHEWGLAIGRTVQDLYSRMTPKDLDSTPQVPADAFDVIRQLRKAPGAEMHVGEINSLENYTRSVVAAQNKPEPVAAVSQKTAMEVYRRMGLPEGDPNKITKKEQIAALYTPTAKNPTGQLNVAHFNWLTNALEQSRTEEGQRIDKVQRDFLHAVTPQIDNSNDVFNFQNPEGRIKMFEFSQYVNRKVREYQAAGKDPHILFTPPAEGHPNPDYLGNPGVIKMFKPTGTPQFQINPGGKPAAGAPEVKPREPGQSFGDWLRSR